MGVSRSEPKIPERDEHLISIDEHAIARFTKKFAIKKGFHTIRNKRMKIEKLFFAFDLGTRRLLSLVVTPGNATWPGLASSSWRGSAAASGANRKGNPKRPGFKQNALTLYAWVAALAANALDAFATEIQAGGPIRSGRSRSVRMVLEHRSF